MRRNNLTVLVLALILGSIAAVLARNWLINHGRSNAAQTAGTIVVAAAPLSFGTQITGENVKEIPWSAAALPEGAFATKQEMLNGGRRMALVSIALNEPVLRGRITAPGQRAALSSMLDPGKRAVTVRVDDVRGVAGFIQPGDRVDVVLIRTEAESKIKEGYSDVILQYAKVLAIDQITGERTEQPTIAKAVTLEVSAEEAQKILLATNVGRLTLILRQPAEAKVDPVRRVTENDLGGPAAVPKPVVPVAPPVQVQAPPPPPPPPPKPAPPRTRHIVIWHGMKDTAYERPIAHPESDGDEPSAKESDDRAAAATPKPKWNFFGGAKTTN
jgi:pilus assembly protein CpaB